MIPKGKISVYFHLNPQTGLPFYVGIGLGFRPYRITGRSVLWNRHVKKYGIEIKIVHLFDTMEEAKEKEIEYIKQYGRIDIRTGILVNHTDGGDGTLGGIHNVGSKRTPEQRAKISAALKGRKIEKSVVEKGVKARKENREKRIQAGEPQKKRILSEKELNRLRTMNIGRKHDDAFKERVSKMFKGKPKTPEHNKKNSEALKGRVMSEETKEKLSVKAKQQWENKNTWYYH